MRGAEEGSQTPNKISDLPRAAFGVFEAGTHVQDWTTVEVKAVQDAIQALALENSSRYRFEYAHFSRFTLYLNLYCTA